MKTKASFSPSSLEKLLQINYWSGFSGLPDEPENYQKVTYALLERDGNAELTVTQDNLATEEGRTQSEQNWSMVLQKLKELLEG